MLTTFFKNKRVPLKRYMLSGSLVFLLGLLQYRYLYLLLKKMPMRTGTAWGLHFIITTVRSHALHRGFTFRDQPQLPYLDSLIRTFGSYAFILVASTLMMILLCDVGRFYPLTGWILDTGFCAVCNFVIMSRWTICCTKKDDLNEIDSAHPDCSD
jgi:putative flippase GtrA